MRNRGQDIKRITAFWGEAWIICRWAMQIEAEIFGQLLFGEDIRQQLLITGPQNHGVLITIVKLPIGPEIPDKQTHRIIGARDLLIRPNLARLIAKEL